MRAGPTAETPAISGEYGRQRWLLAAVALITAGPIAYMAVRQPLDYDGWWHVFIAREVPWAPFWQDVYVNAHPPGFYLLLSAAAKLGAERWVYRAISVVAGVVATYLVGRIGARVFRTSAVAPLCALAFGLSMATVIMATAVRSYMLSLAFLLAAVRPYMDLIDPRHGRSDSRTRVWFVTAVIGAILTHYSAMFFVGVAVALPCLDAAVAPHYRAWWRQRLRRSWRHELATVLALVATVVAVYLAHESRFERPMSHVQLFFPSAAERSAGPLRGAWAFLTRSIAAEIDLFTPLPIASLGSAARGVAVTACGLAGVGLLLLLRRRADWVVALAPSGILTLLATVMMAAALAGRYPFGGFLRQQFVLFPFIMLSGFALLDEGMARLTQRRLVVIAVSAVIVMTSVVQWRALQFMPNELGALELAQFDRFFPDAHAVVVDQFSLIPFFAVHQRGEWPPQSEVGAQFAALPMREPSRDWLVLRDLAHWNWDPSAPQLYRDLHQLLERTRLPSIDVFHLREGAYLLPKTPTLERAQLSESVLQTAHDAGLHIERLVLDGYNTYARVSFSFPNAADAHATAPVLPATVRGPS
jgi:hypothetical protein